MSDRIENTADLLDSRDIIARIAELEGKRDDYPCQCEPGALDNDDCTCNGTEWATANPEDAEELAALSKLAEEAEGCAADWKYGETLVRDSYFREYAEQLAEDTGAVNGDNHWPLYCIDWERAARELQYDYTGVDFDGVTYWVRS